MNPEITVLMSVYNGEKFLEEAIESILNQTYENFEFIIINDGSIDSSLDIIMSFNDPRILLVDNKKNIGLTRSLNKGAELARGEYIARMDADDISFQNRFERQIAFMQQNPQLAVVGGAVVKINESGTKLGTMRYPIQDKRIKETLLNNENCIPHPAALIKKKAFFYVRGYRVCFDSAQDYDLWLRIADYYELANLPNPLLYLRAHKNQVTVKKLRQQIISALGAKTAAKIRHETGIDPLDGIERVTHDTLYQLGLTDRTIEKAFIEGYITWAENMNSMGGKTTMVELLAEARNIVNSHKFMNFKPLLAYGYLRCAKTLYDQTKYREGLDFLLEAIRLDPAIIINTSKRFFRFSQSHIYRIGLR